MATSKWSTTNLVAKPRPLGTKSSNNKLRAAFQLPAVIYGPKIKENVNISIDYVCFEKLFPSNERHIPFVLNVDSQEYKVIVKDYKIDPVSRRFMHVDFYALEEGCAYTTLIPIEFTGTPVGVREGGNLLTYVRKVSVNAIPKDMPSKITIDISGMTRKQNIIVRDIPVPKNCKILTNKGTVLTEVK